MPQQRPDPINKNLIFKSGLVLLIAAALVPLFLLNPEQHAFPSCTFYKLSGLYCPGCGGTRAAHALLHGHLGAAFAKNQLIFFILPTALVLHIRKDWCQKPAVAWTIVVVVIAYWILRNIPCWPFCLLAPH